MVPIKVHHFGGYLFQQFHLPNTPIMKKKITRVYALFWAVLAGSLFLSFNSNPPDDRTGAPPSFTTCASATGGCHSGGTGTGNVTIAGLPATIDPNTTYPISVTVTRTNSNPLKGGFQMVVLDDNNDNIGTLSNPGANSTTQSSGGRTFFEHNPAVLFGGSDDITFTVDWTSPATGTGGVTMYSAALLANNNGSNDGDVTVTTTASGTFAGGGGPITVDVTGTDVSCFGGNDGTATATATGGGGPPYSYAWSNGGTGATITGLTAGTYTVTATDPVGASGTGSITINEPATPVSVTATNLVHIDCTNPVGSATAEGSGGTPGYSYVWSNGSTTQTASFTAPGTYVVTATDANGCTGTGEAVILENTTPPIADAGPTMVITCNNTTVTLDGTGSSSGANILYEWTTLDGNIVSGANTTTPVVDEAGTYTLTVTDTDNGCTAEDDASVLEDTTPPTADAGPDMSLNCNNTSVMLDGSGSSSGADISYLWTTADGNIVSGETTTMPTVDAEGTYTLTVTDDGNGCTATDEAAVTQTPALTASISSQTNVDCNGNSTGNATVAGAGGNGAYSYEWSNGETTQTISDLAAGAYTVTITDADDCTATATATITEPDVLLANASATDETAAGANDGTATADPTGGTSPFIYEWSNGETTQTIINLPPGTYSITVTDDNGCTATESVMVNGFDCSSFTLQTSQINVTCNGGADGEATAIPAGGDTPYTYIWSNGGTTQTITDLVAGTYTVTATEANGCEEIATVNISEPTAIVISTTSLTDVSCNGGNDGEVTVAASGGTPGHTFLWSNGGMGSTLANLTADQYTVTVTDQNNCTETMTVTISEPTTLTATATQTTNALCNGEANGTATIAASGGIPGYSFEWPDGGTGASRNDLAAGTYTVTATDANDCTTTVELTIGEPAAITINVTATDLTAVGADDGTANAEPGGGTIPYSYLWNNGASTQQITGLPPGTYCVTVTDGNGCTTDGCATVNPFGCGNTSIEVSGNDVSCFGGSDGSAEATATGFAPPVSFVWSNNETTANIENLMAGNYSVTVSDASGCSEVDEIEIAQPDELSVSATNVSNVTCPGDTNGSITVAGSGGTPGYSFEWPDGSTNATIENLESGNYEVTITDANDCTATENIEVGVDPDTELPVVTVQDITVELDANGMASITAAMIDNGSTDNCGIDTMLLDISDFTCDDIGENEVVLAVADLSNNCAFDKATVTVVDNISPTITCPDNITVQSTSCTEVVEYGPPTVADNCPNPTFELIAGSPSGSAFSSGTTNIVFEAMDASGNADTCSFTITIDNGFSGAVTSTPATCNGFEDGTATADPAGGVPPYAYQWDDANNQTTQTATGLGAGNYTVTITDAAGCSTVATVEVAEPDALEIVVDEVVHVYDLPGEIKISVSGGTGSYSYEWVFNGNFFSDEEDISNLDIGDYFLTVTDENGCALDTTIVVSFFDAVTYNPGLEQYVTLFPNPATDRLFLKFDLPSASAVSVSLYNLNGRLALPVVNDYFSRKTINLELNNMAAGIYIVRFVVDDGVLMKRIVVGK